MKLEKAEKILSLQLDWVKTADSKVPPVFAINIAMLAVISALISSVKVWCTTLLFAVSLPVLLLLLSIVFLSLVMFPRLKGPVDSFVFFGEIAKKSETSFIREFQNQSESDYICDLLSQTHRNAEIASNKYLHVKRAMIASFISLPFWLIAIYMLYG